MKKMSIRFFRRLARTAIYKIVNASFLLIRRVNPSDVSMKNMLLNAARPIQHPGKLLNLYKSRRSDRSPVAQDCDTKVYRCYAL